MFQRTGFKIPGGLLQNMFTLSDPFDYFLWVYFKRKIYVSLPRNMTELDQNIREEFAQILKEIKWAGITQSV